VEKQLRAMSRTMLELTLRTKLRMIEVCPNVDKTKDSERNNRKLRNVTLPPSRHNGRPRALDPFFSHPLDCGLSVEKLERRVLNEPKGVDVEEAKKEASERTDQAEMGEVSSNVERLDCVLVLSFPLTPQGERDVGVNGVEELGRALGDELSSVVPDGIDDVVTGVSTASHTFGLQRPIFSLASSIKGTTFIAQNTNPFSRRDPVRGHRPLPQNFSLLPELEGEPAAGGNAADASRAGGWSVRRSEMGAVEC
jgi:hypothetical protein